MKIEIVTTANDELKETGFGTLKACKSIFKSLQKNLYDVRLSICTSESDLEGIIARKPDLAMLAVKYVQLDDGKKIWLSEYFEGTGINYTGSKRDALAFDSDKVLAKDLVKSKNIRTADYFTATPNEYNSANELPIDFPLFLKPLDAANSNGIDELSLVNGWDSFKNKVNALYEKYNQPVLVEEYLGGREFTVAIIEDLQNAGLIVASIEIIAPENKDGIRILGKKVKSDDSEERKPIDDLSLKTKIEKMAVDTFHVLGVRGFGRIDIKMDYDGHCYFMEANLVPGMTEGSSYFPKAFEIDLGIDYDNVIELMLKQYRQ